MTVGQLQKEKQRLEAEILAVLEAFAGRIGVVDDVSVVSGIKTRSSGQKNIYAYITIEI